MSIIEILKVLVLGIVEGFTEWLPISSTGHMILVDEIIHLNVTQEFKDVFMVVIQLGAILAVVLLYFHKLNPFIRTRGRSVKGAVIPLWGDVALKKHTVILWMKVVVACVPAAVMGLLFDDWMEAHLFNAYVVAAALIVYGVLFIVLENSSVCTNPRFNKVGQISAKTAFLIGMVQLLALIPGTSRSGSTILGAMVLGCSRAAAAEFSFFLGIPVMFGASLLKIVKYFLAGNVFTGPQIFYTILGMLIAFVVSIYSIQFLMSYVRKHDFKFFGYYRIILGVIVLAYFGITALAS